MIRQELPGEPLRDISLIEVTYPPATGSPPHLHANGVMAFVVSGTIVSKVGDGAEQTFCRRCLVGTSGRDPSGLAQCEFDRAGDPARDLRRAQECDSGRIDETYLMWLGRALIRALMGRIRSFGSPDVEWLT